MGSQSPLKLPKVDFSVGDLLQPGSGGWNGVRADVRHALENYGCFEAVFPGVPMELRKATIRSLEELFALPVATKVRNTSPKPFHGYVGQYPILPLYESMGIEDSDLPERVEKFASIMWPDGNSIFSETIVSFSKSVSKLDQLVRTMVLDSLGLMEKYKDSHMDSTNYLLRMMRYRGPESEDPKLGLTEHTDKNIVTILFQNQGGLEVLTKGGDWIPVAASSDSFIVMVGDSFLAWTNGRVHSPVHRVVMRGREKRYSVGLFSVPKSGHIIQAPEELVDEDHPLLFKPFDQVDFLKFYYTEEGQRVPSALTTYCGA